MDAQTNSINTSYTFDNLSGIAIASTFSYTSSTVGCSSCVLHNTMAIDGGTLSSFTGPETFEAISPPGATFVGLQMNGANPFMPPSGALTLWGINQALSNLTPPPVGAWFCLEMGGPYQDSGNPWIWEADYALNACIDPTLGTIRYLGPNQSEIDFTPSATAAQSNSLWTNYSGTWQGSGVPPHVQQETLQGLFTGTPNPGVTAAMPKVTNLSIQRAPATCGDERDALIQEYQAKYPFGKSKVPVEWAPVCADFTSNAATIHYSFAALDVDGIADGQTFALLRYALMVPKSFGYGLDSWVKEIQETATDVSVRHLNSGYRSPTVNQRAGGTFQPGLQSRHMFGDAVDLRNDEGFAARCLPADEATPGVCCVPSTYVGMALGGTCSGPAGAATVEHVQLVMAAENAHASYTEPYYFNSGAASPCFQRCVHADWRNLSGLYAPDTYTSPNNQIAEAKR